MTPNDIEAVNKELLKLQNENQRLREELSYESKKHKQWKSLAMCFHDSLWKLIDKYIMNEIT